MPGRQEPTEPPPLMEPVYVEEPHHPQEYADVLRAVLEHHPVVVQRRGIAVAAIISLEHLQLLQDALARQEAENLAAQIDWTRVAKTEPPAEWLEGDEPKPF
ncbi:MAG TPA: hypothetical protein VGG06_02700 [Thermoanaerobaculia bacterium]|jgi:PHD/YefM family antitoxin component YafN of YafNO toxin-antitoxin module